MARVFLFAVVFVLSGCFDRPEVVTDYTTRSTVYGWLDISDITGNHLTQVLITQHQPPSEYPYNNMFFDKFQGGYIFYSSSFPVGSFSLEKLSLQSCLGKIICGNTINEYNFGEIRGLGTLRINKPGVYFVGNIKMIRGKNGLFRPGTFSFKPAARGPSKRQLLEYLVANVVSSDHPIITQRIRAALRRQ